MRSANRLFVGPLRFICAVVAGIVILSSPIPAHAQGCSLCYTQAAAATQRFIEALRSGILILIAPPTLASVGMIFVVYRKRNQVRQSEEAQQERIEG